MKRLLVLLSLLIPACFGPEKVFRAGAATSNITPALGELIVGGWQPYPATHVHDELHARCLVLDDGEAKLAIVICDVLGIPKEVCDLARTKASEATRIPEPNILIAATHTHSATTTRGPKGVIYPDALSDYRAAGYDVISCSAESSRNLDKLSEALSGRTSIVVGQSGVGKSSVINKIVGSEQRTAALSRKFVEGRHTTVSSIMLDLPGGGYVVDSPGVRDYSPAIESDEEAIRGFREISKAGHDCRFANCKHLREPDCAVKKAVEDGQISPRRYESYKRLIALSSERAGKKY